MEDLFDELTIRMRRYSEDIQSRRVSPSADAVEGLRALDVPLQDDPCSPTEVLSSFDSGKRQPFHYVPELSRRARGVEVWAALRSLGKKGLAELIERNCRQASRFAEGLKAAGYSILNEVVLNQVLVSFGEPDVTDRIIRRIQEEGTCWCGGTQWQGQHAMRISVSSWRTTDEDVRLSLDAILRIAAEEVQEE